MPRRVTVPTTGQVPRADATHKVALSGGRWAYYGSLNDAVAAAAHVFKQSGVLVAVEAVRRENPPRRGGLSTRGAQLMSKRVVDLTYKHVASAQDKPYRHKFGAGTRLYGLSDGSLLLRNPAKRLWDFYEVEDDA